MEASSADSKNLSPDRRIVVETEEALRVLEWERSNHALGRPVDVESLFAAMLALVEYARESEAQAAQADADLAATETRRDELQAELDKANDTIADLESRIDRVTVALEDQITALSEPTSAKPKKKTKR